CAGRPPAPIARPAGPPGSDRRLVTSGDTMVTMAAPLPALRRNLELMPSPVPESPGLLVRDPFRYADGILILPPPLVPCLLLFDGRHDEGDLREVLVRLTGNVEVGELLGHLRDTLSRGGLLENEVFEG